MGEILGDPYQIIQFAQRGAFLEQPCQVEEDLQVGINGALDVRALHLDHYILAAGQQRFIYLRDGGGGDGCGVEGGEPFLDWGFQLRFDARFGNFPRRGRHHILEFFQFADINQGDEVRAGAQNLAEFDEGRAELLEGQTHVRCGSEMWLHRLAAQQATRQREGGQQTQLVHDAAESVPDQDVYNLLIALEVPVLFDR